MSTHFSFVISVGQPVTDLVEVHRTFDGAHQALALVYLEAQLLRCVFEQLRLAKQLGACRAQLGCLLEHKLHHVVEVIRVAHRQVWHRSFADFTEQSLHVFSLEGRLQSAHLIEDAAHRPYVRFQVVRLIVPYLGRCIVRSTSLCLEHSLGYLAHIQIA